MTPIDDKQKESILQRISFVEVELGDIKKFKGLDYKNYSINRDERRNIERLIENIANSIIDIGKIVIAGENLPIPDSYIDVFDRLEEIRLIDTGLGTDMKSLVRLRNTLAHQYLDLKWESIKEFRDKGYKFIYDFIKAIKSSLLP